MKQGVALLAAASIAGIGGSVAPAYADDSGVARLVTAGMTAAGHGASDCGDFPPDAPGAGRDGWVFQAPASFESVRLEFGMRDGRSTLVELGADLPGGPTGDSRFFDNGTELWLGTPAGWTLRSGSAEIAGTAGAGFALIRTCWGQEPVAAPVARGASDGSTTQKIVVVIAPTGSKPPTSEPPTSRSPSAKPPGSGGPGRAAGPAGHLPKTGEPIGLLVAVAVALIVVGAALRLVRRTGG